MTKEKRKRHKRRINKYVRIDKIKIKDIRKTKAKSVIMQFEIHSDLQKFKDHPKLESLQIKKLEKSSPNFIRCGQFDNS